MHLARGVSYVPNTVEPLSLELPLRRVRTLLHCVMGGHFIKVNNYVWLLDTLKSLPDHAYALDIFGCGPEQAVMEAMITEHHVPGVSIHGPLPKMQLMEKLRDANVLPHPSRLEGMPNVVLESLELGPPMFLSDTDAHRDIVTIGCDGFSLLDDPATFVSLMQEMLRQP